MATNSILLAAFAVLLVSPVFGQQTDPPTFAPAFYAFENGVNFGSAENDAKTLRELGYAGISQTFSGGEKLAERVATFDKLGLKVLSVYLNVGDTPITFQPDNPHRGGNAAYGSTNRSAPLPS